MPRELAKPRLAECASCVAATQYLAATSGAPRVRWSLTGGRPYPLLGLPATFGDAVGEDTGRDADNAGRERDVDRIADCGQRGRMAVQRDRGDAPRSAVVPETDQRVPGRRGSNPDGMAAGPDLLGPGEHRAGQDSSRSDQAESRAEPHEGPDIWVTAGAESYP